MSKREILALYVGICFGVIIGHLLDGRYDLALLDILGMVAGGLAVFLFEFYRKRRCQHEWFDMTIHGENISTCCRKCGDPKEEVVGERLPGN